MPLPVPLADTVDEVTGRRRRADPVREVSGGPAGNARMTAWTGLILLVLFLSELVTVLDVSGLISWHVVLGALLVPFALVKTGSTSWRVVRYYTGDRDYVTAGPPPTPLRLLGPLVVASTLGLLGSGLALIALGRQAGQRPFVTVLGVGLDTLTLHQAMFFAFAAATGLHLLARIAPAVRLVAGRATRDRTVPGGGRRAMVVVVAVLTAAATAALVLSATGSWKHDGHHRGGPGSLSVPAGRSGAGTADTLPA